jgi:hypothetical protein
MIDGPGAARLASFAQSSLGEIRMKLGTLFVSSAPLLCLAHEALADKTYILATGRRDPRMYAIVGGSKVALDGLNGRPLGDSANFAISQGTTNKSNTQGEKP